MKREQNSDKNVNKRFLRIPEALDALFVMISFNILILAQDYKYKKEVIEKANQMRIDTFRIILCLGDFVTDNPQSWDLVKVWIEPPNDHKLTGNIIGKFLMSGGDVKSLLTPEENEAIGIIFNSIFAMKEETEVNGGFFFPCIPPCQKSSLKDVNVLK